MREVLGESPPPREVERAEKLRRGVARRLVAWREFRRGTATGAEWARRLYAVVLRLDLPRPSPARIEVFDSQGRSLHRIDLGVLAAGPYPVRWDGTDRSGRDVGSGVFWVRAEVGGAVLRKQVVRLR